MGLCKAQEGMMNMPMSMYMDGIHFTIDPDQQCLIFLFQGWVVDSYGRLIVTLIVCIAMGMLNGALFKLRSKARMQFPIKEAVQATDLMHGLLYGFQMLNAYLCMLLVMTYYAGYILTTVLGLTLGHMMFQKSTVSEQVDPCCAASPRGKESVSIQQDYYHMKA